MSSISYATHLIAWLRDAHAMEANALTALEWQVDHPGNYLNQKRQAEQHIKNVRRQKILLERRIERLGGSISTFKDLAGESIAPGQSVTEMAATDEAIKKTVGSYVLAQRKIALYTVLIAAAQANGDIETRQLCEEILPQEIATANWALGRLAEMTKVFLLDPGNIQAASDE